VLRRITGGVGRLVLTLVAAVAIGFGVPLLWVWIGSVIQGGEEGTSVDASTAVAMLLGIVLTYLLVLVVGGWLQARFGTRPPGDQRPVRYPWTRSMRDEPYRPGQRKLSPLESAFVLTAIVVSAALLLWFFLWAGSPLPQGA
jgi:multisubunit Na+/H+ antiporter MnhC subunit